MLDSIWLARGVKRYLLVKLVWFACDMLPALVPDSSR